MENAGIRVDEAEGGHILIRKDKSSTAIIITNNEHLEATERKLNDEQERDCRKQREEEEPMTNRKPAPGPRDRSEIKN